MTPTTVELGLTWTWSYTLLAPGQTETITGITADYEYPIPLKTVQGTAQERILPWCGPNIANRWKLSKLCLTSVSTHAFGLTSNNNYILPPEYIYDKCDALSQYTKCKIHVIQLSDLVPCQLALRGKREDQGKNYGTSPPLFGYLEIMMMS